MAQKRSTEFAELAQHFLDRDIPVFPVKHDSKIPLTPKGFKDASTNPKQIKKWAKRFPDANIGVPTGKVSRIIVVDLDRKSGADGIANFRSLCKTLGIKVPGTYKVQTPSGGRHLYFRSKFAGSIRNTAGVLGLGIDVRATRGVCPCGRQRYRWISVLVHCRQS